MFDIILLVESGSMAGIILTCMDRRLNERTDNIAKAMASEVSDGVIIELRNAGANVNGLSETLKEIAKTTNIEKIHIATHTNCGAMKVVDDALKNPEKYSKAIMRSLVDQFGNEVFRGIEGLESVNQIVQERRAREIFGKDVEIKAVLVDVQKVPGIPRPGAEGEHTLIVSMAESGSYVEMCGLTKTGVFATYIIQGGNMNELLPDVEIATKHLKISDVRLLVPEDMRERSARENLELVRAAPFVTGETRFELVRLPIQEQKRRAA